MSKPLEQFSETEIDQLAGSGFTLLFFGKKLDVSELVRENRRLTGQLRSVSAARSRLRRQIRRGE